MGNHELETAFLLLSALGVLCHGFLFALKLSDLIQMKRERRNGPMLFMKRDNIRHQAFMLATSVGMVVLADRVRENTSDVTPLAMDLLKGLVAFCALSIFDAWFVYRRRWKMAYLVAQYEGVPGGKRATDPPAKGQRHGR